MSALLRHPGLSRVRGRRVHPAFEMDRYCTRDLL